MSATPRVGKSVQEIAALTGGEAEGELSLVIDGAAGLSEAGPADISFLGNPKYAQAAAASKAGCLLLSASARGGSFAAKSRVYVEDPQWAFAQVLALIEAARPKPAPKVDPRAFVHPEAKLGAGVSIGPFAVVERGSRIGDGAVLGAQVYIGEDVAIGKGARIYPQAVVLEGCVIGERVVIHSGTVIGADGFGFSTDRKTFRHRKIPQIGNVVISDDVEIGANVTIDRATVGSTVVGPGTKIDNLVQLGHNVRTGKDCLIVSQTGVSGSTTLGDRVILAGQAGLAGHLHIGDGAVVTAKTGIMSDVEKGQVVFGIPGRPHREAFRLQALYGKLPEIYEAIKEIKKKLEPPEAKAGGKSASQGSASTPAGG